MGAKLWEPLKLELPGLGLSDVITPSVTGSVILDRLLNPDPRPALERKQRELESWCRQQAAHSLAAHGLRPEEENELTLAKAIGWAMQQASVVFARSPLGHFGEPAAGVKRPPTEAGGSEDGVAAEPPVSFDDLVAGWAAEKRPAEKTLYEWKRVMRQLAAFVGHSDARRLGPDELIAWKASMINAGLHGKTIRDAKFAPVRAILRWAVDNRILPTNPAERITIDVKTKPGEGRRSFTDDEASLVLKAAAWESDPVRRWAPWLCAYTGARVSEICQLRAEDVLQIDGFWCVKIDPEAGPLKNRSSERAVPLHPALIEAGFLKFVNGIPSGPLFASLPPDKFGKRGGNGTKVLGRWVRSLGLTDPRLSPNHSWRHRLKTLGRRYGLAPDIVDAITGHARRTVADGYGEFPMEALHREISKIPRVSVGDPDDESGRDAPGRLS